MIHTSNYFQHFLRSLVQNKVKIYRNVGHGFSLRFSRFFQSWELRCEMIIILNEPGVMMIIRLHHFNKLKDIECGQKLHLIIAVFTTYQILNRNRLIFRSRV